VNVRSLMPLAAVGLMLGGAGCPDPVTSGGDACPSGWLCFPDGTVTDAYLGEVFPGPQDTGTTDPGTEVVTPDVVGPEVAVDTVITPGGFGAPCDGNEDCLDGWCVEGPDGFVCTETCQEECPAGWTCRSVVTGSSDITFLCVPQVQKLCTPCQADLQCTGGSCLTIDGQQRCAPSCEDSAECPNGYSCREQTAGGGNYCLPDSDSCECTPEVDGGARTCTVSNELGTCFGVETCDPATGWTGCTAATPDVETCDGIDNDCNQLIDDGVVEGEACVNAIAGVGSCAGVSVCGGSAGFVCQGPTPEVEACDFEDNDCDGETDEDFKDADGNWTLQDHCGTCGNSCTNKIPNGTGVCGGDPSSPVCVVAACDADYVQINDFQCALPPDVSCQPCESDGDCYGGTCITLDNQNVCVSPCGAADSSCADGYSCTDLGSAGTPLERCVPDTNSCVCSIDTAGQTRTCKFKNAFGTCFGEETCDAALGWTGCNAPAPAAEVCDGLDNNCNGVADDGVVAPTDPCESTNAFGTCSGTWFCTDLEGTQPTDWWCSAPTPADDICDLQDNDCNGVVDDPFKTNGVYVDDDNCGACGVSCIGSIPNAVASCADNGGEPRCEVVSCDTGYYQAGPLTCLATADSLCAPCGTDANCQVPGDQCLDLDGAKFCGRDCSAGNLHGLAEDDCPAGFVCNDLGGGVKQCQPESASCTCLPGDDGNTRNCVDENTFGQCFGSQTCNSTLGWSTCTALTPSAEVCDGIDNDCDGFQDNVENRGSSCENTNTAGTCTGILDCVAGGGADLVCTADVPAVETCDYADNDCDGSVDEDFALLYESCSAGAGICQRFGFYECATDGSAESCNAVAADSAPETCNGLDDNCDGNIDEGFDDLGTICTAGSGACQNTGITICDASGAGTTCSVSGGDNTPEICDGIDNDCDGLSDEDFVGLGQVCVLGLGNCAQPGTIQCNASQDAAECDATPLPPGVETCNGLDDDCDGQTDAPLVPEDCALQTGVCAGSTRSCGGLSGWLTCQAAEYGADYEPVELTCDGLDNDCDGDTDNGLFAPSCALQDGVCAGSKQSCGGTNGWAACDAAEYGGAYQALNEVGLCDGLDNDCDGQVDEDFPQKGTPCVVGLGECQTVGTYQCNPAGDGVVCSATAGTPSPEVCDGLDNNCDGQIDNNVTDAPNCALTQGVCSGSTQLCVGGVFQACTAANYGADYEGVEFSCDGLDNDCDGDADTADSDVTPPPCANQQGVCNGSVQACGGNSGWQACTNAVYTNYSAEYQAGDETGQCDGLDNDCDGEVDEDFPAKGSVCTVGQGECTAAGTRICTGDGVGLTCSAAAGTAAPELCDGLDNNCDGIVDNNVTDAPDCALTVGVCAGDKQRCISGAFQPCTAAEYGAGYEASEFSCDGLDNDCDGDTDQDDGDVVAPVCPQQLGVCNGAKQSCGGAAGWLACGTTEYGSEYQPGDEADLCDDLDNDCDGDVDEDFLAKGQACTAGVGACAVTGTAVCTGDGLSTECSATPNAAGSESCNGIDDDCDGTVDNNIVGAEACALTLGVCSGSTKTCVSGSFQSCTAAEYGANYEATEFSCDGLDNDCDGLTDEDDPDVVAPPCALQQGVCNGATRACGGASGWLACGATQYGSEYQAGDEVGQCDNLDNDCDGEVDEDFATKGEACSAGVGACNNVGTFVCNGAGNGVQCSASAGSGSAELCNGIDDDCNGVVDDSVTNAPACTLTQGVCGGSVRSCVSGSFQPCTAAEYGAGYEASEFSCDGLDNDCDGDVDTADSDVVAPPCGLQQGVCNGATQACGGATGWQTCNAARYGSDYQAGNEAGLCDDLDNDCDGSIDEDFTTKGNACSAGQGACLNAGVNVCNGGGTGVTCGATPGAAGTETCNGIDDDCNGNVDDGLTLPACPLTLGVCAGSTQACAGASGLQACDAGSYGANYETIEVSCDGFDNDCDGITDNVDIDGDGQTPLACGGTDCDDLNPLAYNGAPETCGDNRDNDCNGVVDDKDSDSDNYIDNACSDYTGALPVTDCDDGESGINPGLAETCGDNLDNDCDGSIDNLDADGDNFIALACGGTDCNDGEATVSPGGIEACDNLDNDCNGVTDDKDLDVDGHVDENCTNYPGALPIDDCDDANVGVNPDQDEVCGNSLDEDCSGAPDDKDIDGDGVFDTDPLCGGTDCNDNDPMIYPGAPEYRDGKDNDCDPDGKADEGVFTAGELVITEVFYDSSQTPDENYEWFEVFNPTDRPINLKTWLMRDAAGSSQEIAVINDDVIVPVRGFATLCRTGDATYNGGVSCDYEYGFFQMSNSADEIFLEFDGSSPVIVDQVEYDESPWPSAISESLNLDPDSFGGDNNASGNWCAHPNGAAYEFGPNTDDGTPGTSNVDCTNTSFPSVAAVHPDNAPDASGTPLTIVGYNFSGASTVTIGGVNCPVTASSLTELVCTMPDTSTGAQDVVVTDGGNSDTLTGAVTVTSNASGGDLITSGVIDRPATVNIVRDTWSQAVFGQVTESGVTGSACPAGGEFATGTLIVEVGFGADNSDPRTTGSWLWFPAFCESDTGAGNEFRGAFFVDTPGTYSYAYRASLDGGTTWNYIDLDGTANGFSTAQMGTATVR